MRSCDRCGTEVPRLAASRRGRWGMNLCRRCWAWRRGQERGQAAATEQKAVAGSLFAWPLCEFCGGDLNAHDLGYYTTRGKPRRFCCAACRATHNSRAGAPIRAAIARDKVRRGQWRSPGQAGRRVGRDQGRGGEGAAQLRADLGAEG